MKIKLTFWIPSDADFYLRHILNYYLISFTKDGKLYNINHAGVNYIVERAEFKDSTSQDVLNDEVFCFKHEETLTLFNHDFVPKSFFAFLVESFGRTCMTYNNQLLESKVEILEATTENNAP